MTIFFTDHCRPTIHRFPYQPHHGHEEILKEKTFNFRYLVYPFPTINCFIPLKEFSLHYHDIDQAIILIKNAAVAEPGW